MKKQKGNVGKTFSITIPIPVHDQLAKRAEELNVSRSAFVRHILIAYVEEQNSKVSK